MRLLIERKDLELLLEKKRNLIGKDVPVDTLIAGISFLLSAVTASYETYFGIQGIVFKSIFLCISLLYMVKIIIDMIDVYKNRYNHVDLMKDIERLDMIQHNHSLICISRQSDTKEFLVYYDERWDCKLFLNYKTQEHNNEAYILDCVSDNLGIDRHILNCRYITSRVQEKYSVSHKENRIYNHRLYEVYMSNMPSDFMNMDFVVNNIHYYWMTIADMEKDSNILEKNIEVVDFVKEVIS